MTTEEQIVEFVPERWKTNVPTAIKLVTIAELITLLQSQPQDQLTYFTEFNPFGDWWHVSFWLENRGDAL